MDPRRLLPPAAIDLGLRLTRSRIGFTGAYATWDEALEGCATYESRHVVDAYREEVLREAQERQSRWFDSREMRLVAALQTAAAMRGRGVGGLSVVDLGGAAGRHYRLLRRIPSLTIDSYVIGESAAVADALNAFGDGCVAWTSFSTASAIRSLDADLFLASSTLQYLPDPFEWLEAAATFPVVIIDRLPLIAADRDFVARQHTRYGGEGVTYPAWFFSEQRFFEKLDHMNLRCVMRWEVPEDSPIVGSRRVPNQGMLLAADQGGLAAPEALRERLER